MAIDRIADILIEIQDNMKKILERLKRVEHSLQENKNVGSNYQLVSFFILFEIKL